MLSLQSKISQESKLFPGVGFTVRRLNHIQRAKRNFAVLSHAARIQELLVEYRRILESAGVPTKQGANETEEKERQQAASKVPRAAGIDSEIGQLLDAHLKPAAIKAGLLSIEGFEIDGKPATVEDVLEYAPSGLLEEIYLACESASGLSAEEQKNSPSPGLSPGQADGIPTPTNALFASGSARIGGETAAATSPS